MPNVVKFAAKTKEVVTQDDLDAWERALHLKVKADELFIKQVLIVSAKIAAGASIEPGPKTYHKNLGVISKN